MKPTEMKRRAILLAGMRADAWALRHLANNPRRGRVGLMQVADRLRSLRTGADRLRDLAQEAAMNARDKFYVSQLRALASTCRNQAARARAMRRLDPADGGEGSKAIRLAVRGEEAAWRAAYYELQTCADELRRGR